MRAARSVLLGAALTAGAVGLTLFLVSQPQGRDVTLPAGPRDSTASAEAAALGPSASRTTERSAVVPEPASLASAPPSGSGASNRAEDRWVIALVGRVTDESGAPIEGAELVNDEIVRARSDAEGLVQVLPEASVPWTEYEGIAAAHVSARGHATKTLELRVEDGATILLGTILLAGGADVSGIVRDEAGQPIGEARLSLYGMRDWSEDAEEPRPRLSTHDRWPLLEALSDKQGRYRLRGAPAAEVFLEAWADGWQGTWTRPFLLRAGEDRVLDWTLPSDGKSYARWTIRALDPRGVAVPDARVTATDPVGYGFRKQGVTDGDGVFELRLRSGVEVRIVAEDPGERWRPSPEELRVPRENEAFDLVLREASFVTVVVTDQQDEPVPWSNVQLLREGRGPPLSPRPQMAGADGSLRILLPGVTFRINAWATGFAHERFGPFDPATIDTHEPLFLRLPPGRALRGRVLAAGEPVRDAALTLRKRERKATWMSSEISSAETPFLVATLDQGQRVTTDETGAFALNTWNDGQYTVLVEASGFPLQAFGPYELLSSSSTEHALELTHGGALEGRVWLPGDATTADHLVGASSGTGVVFTTPIGADGTYRIDNLAPGSYQVLGCRPPAARLHRLDGEGLERAIGELAPDCVVRAGATRRFDLDLRAQGSVVLEGSFPAAAQPESAGLLRGAEERVFCWAEIDPDGGFRFVLSNPGLYRLRVHTASGFFEVPMRLSAGTRSWSADLAFGQVTVVGWEPKTKELTYSTAILEDLILAWQGAGGTRYEARVWDGDETTIPFPAGRVEVLRVEDSLREPLREPFTLLEGETVVLDLSR